MDHHPRRDGYQVDWSDIRPTYGAASTIVTEYLRTEAESRIHERLATALLYGIRTDTDTLVRGATPADIEAYAFLQERADPVLLRRVSRPSFNARCIRALGEALAAVQVEDHVAVSYLGRLGYEESHILPILADFCLSLEGVAWAAAAALIGDELALAIRWAGSTGPGAGHVARDLAEHRDRGGGHATMARVTMAADRIADRSPEPGAAGATAEVLELIVDAVHRVRDAAAD